MSHHETECAGCGSHVVDATCSQLTVTTSNVFACPSTARILCADDYHVCTSSSEASELGFNGDTDCDASIVTVGNMHYLTGESATFDGVLCCANAPEIITTTGAATTESQVEWVEPCENNTCNCDEDDYCRVCQSHGQCSQCMNGYFRLGHNYPCANCQEVFGSGCMFCQNFNGCGQCSSGYKRMYDNVAHVWYCE